MDKQKCPTVLNKWEIIRKIMSKPETFPGFILRQCVEVNDDVLSPRIFVIASGSRALKKMNENKWKNEKKRKDIPRNFSNKPS